MLNQFFLSAIPDREATAGEALKLVGEGWGSIFIVIFVMILVTIALNKAFRK